MIASSLSASDGIFPEAIFRHEEQSGHLPAKDLLRFITCGSVDDGKSTLIGRLLYEAKSLFDDQLDTLQAESRKYGKAGDGIDFSLLVDGLASEREQGITIDIAYRFFETKNRKFIVADTPGHEQYTRNMATGASTASLAVLLVDARLGILPQTRRHALILSRLGLRHTVLAVNKIDLVGHDEATFRRIAAEYRQFAADLGFKRADAIPVSARNGDNIASSSEHMPWYEGPTLLACLEAAPTVDPAGFNPFRMSVQSVIRPDGAFRGYAGLIASGRITPGDEILVQPSARRSRIGRIVTADGDLAEASAGQSVVLTLEDHVDVGRGDLLAIPDQPAIIGKEAEVETVWMSETPLAVGQRLLVKAGTRSVTARVEGIPARTDIASGNETPAESLALNDIGRIRLYFDAPLALDTYRKNRETGSMLLIDPQSFDTLGIGMVGSVSMPDASAERIGDSYGAMEGLPSRQENKENFIERRWRSLAKAISWRLTGSADTFILSLLFTGNAKTSAAIGAAEILTKTGLYYVHERAWSKTSIGRTNSSPTSERHLFRRWRRTKNLE